MIFPRHGRVSRDPTRSIRNPCLALEEPYLKAASCGELMGSCRCRLMGAELIATYLLIALLYLFMHDPKGANSAALSLAKAVVA